MFWKKVNRGLILGAALLVFLVGFIVLKEVQFNKETPLIRARVETYLSDLCATQCGIQGQLGEVLPGSVQEAQKEKLDRVLTEHWYGNLPEDEYKGMGVSEIRTNYNRYLSDPVEILLSKAEVHLQKSNMNVYKDGPDRAMVSFSAEIKTEYTGDGNSIFFGDLRYIDYEDGYAIPEETTEVSGKAYSGVYFINGTIEVERVGGEWKIVGFSGYGYSSMASEKGE